MLVLVLVLVLVLETPCLQRNNILVVLVLVLVLAVGQLNNCCRGTMKVLRLYSLQYKSRNLSTNNLVVDFQYTHQLLFAQQKEDMEVWLLALCKNSIHRGNMLAIPAQSLEL